MPDSEVSTNTGVNKGNGQSINNNLVDEESKAKLNSIGISDEDIAEDRKRLQEQEEKEKKLERQANRKFNTFKPTKIIGFNSARVDIVYRDDRGKPIAYQQWQKRKPNREFIKISPKTKRNPNKYTLASTGKYPENRQIYKYDNNDDYIYISKGIDLIQLDIDDFYDMILQVIGATFTNDKLMEKIINSDFRLQFMSKSKLPHYKLKDWSKDRKFIHVSPEELDKNYEDELNRKKEERDKFYQ